MDDIQMLRKKNAELVEEIQDYNEDVREQRKKQDEAVHRNAEERNKIFDKICQIGGKTTKDLERKGWRN
jgi:DNA-binding protein H-NS